MSFLPKSVKNLKKRRLLAFFIFISITIILFSGYVFVEKFIDLKILVLILFALAIIQVFVLQYFFKNQLKNDLIKSKLSERIHDLKLSLEEANEVGEYRSVYLANINYEIRTPLSTVLGMLSMLKQSDLDDNQREKLEIAEYSSKQLHQLVNMVTDEADVDFSNIKINLLAMNLETELSDLFKVFEYIAWARDIDFEYKFLSKGKKNFSLLGDSFRIQQVLFNLINNAIKFTNFGVISVIIDQSIDIDNEQIVSFYIKDTGVGMPSYEVKQFLNHGKTLRSSIIKDYRGGGLGLSISRQLVEKMGGELKLETKKNEGSTFYFSLQLQKTLNVKEDKAELAPKLQNKLSVLVAEDNRMNQRVIKFLLEKEGADCTFAKNGLEALELYKILDFDMIFMDIYMPDMDGYQATKAIKKTKKYKANNTPIIGVSASAFKKDSEQAKLAGIDDFLSKPLESSILKDLLSKYNQKENTSV